MRIAVISDVHANLHALEAVLAAVGEERPDALWCLGDVVGYGPRPGRCCEIVAAHADVGLVGNHDLGVLGEIDISSFAPDAAAAAAWTAEILDDADRDYLSSLSPSALLPSAALYHASPRDPVWEYVLSPEVALAAIVAAPRDLVAVGHSHVALAVSLADSELSGGLAPEGTEIALAGAKVLLNPGSVGQPRDGDPRAAWMLLDLARGIASFRRADYPIELTQAEILDEGLPESLAARLADGI
jgi:predicted phosphodiesterase